MVSRIKEKINGRFEKIANTVLISIFGLLLSGLSGLILAGISDMKNDINKNAGEHKEFREAISILKTATEVNKTNIENLQK